MTATITIRQERDVTEDVLAAAWLALGRQAIRGPGDRIDWEAVWDRMEATDFTGGGARLDVGRRLDSPAQRLIQANLRARLGVGS